MGAYVSRAQCLGFHSVELNCTLVNAIPYRIIGGLQHGKFEADPDIAGVGVLYAFFSVTCFALFTSIIYLILQLTRFMRFTGINPYAASLQEAAQRRKSAITWADVFETIILTCSDQQIFTAGAYALTLRYSQGCKISAYHYNIVANTLLITCATHLMSVTVVSEYWKHKLLAAFRTCLVTALYIVTALLLSNQSANSDLQWPMDVPTGNETDTLLVLPAACFQDDKSTLDKTLFDTFGRGGSHLAVDAIGLSSPNNRIVGWNYFILMILWYGAAIVAEGLRLLYFWRRNKQGNGPIKRRTWRVWAGRAFWFYQFAGTVFSSVAIVMSYLYIQKLRNWLDHSPWLNRENGGTNPENDATTFGQLVPMLLILLTVFGFLQVVGDKFSDYLKQGSEPDYESQTRSTVYYKPYSYGPSEKNGNTSVQVTSIPSTPLLKLDDPRASPSPMTPSAPIMPTNSLRPTSNITMATSNISTATTAVTPRRWN